ncbi:MAG: hypothetical protein OXQ29_26070 [Rhodospirillaceae bacterium]|nr:hypothetical protein [Rhodospirillaceae bacterium]
MDSLAPMLKRRVVLDLNTAWKSGGEYSTVRPVPDATHEISVVAVQASL